MKLEGKKLLVLGGVLGMVELTKRAQELGVKVYVTDYLEDSPAKKYADKSFMVSTTDVDAVVELCNEEGIDGIITGNVDLLLPYYAQICEKTKLPCYGTYEHFMIMTDKELFKNVCRKYNVPVIKEYENTENLKNVQFPVLIKPVDSSGSKGISICNDENELLIGIEKALSFSRSKRYMIEKYMTGDEAVLYYYFQNEKPVFMGMCDRYVNKEQQGVAQVSTAYIFPSRYTQKHMEVTDKLIKNMYKELKVQNGSTFLQAFIEEDLPVLYEPGYRLNGAREQYIYSNTNEIDITTMLINFALTGKMDECDIETKADPMLNGKVACMLSPVIKQGTVSRIEGMDKIKELEAVKKVILINEVGNCITEKVVGTLSQIAFRAYIVEDNMMELKKVVDKILDTVVYYDENNESMMLTPFDTNLLLTNY